MESERALDFDREQAESLAKLVVDEKPFTFQ